MTSLSWDPKNHRLERGIEHGVLYLGNESVVWNGLISVEENDDSSLDLTHYYDGLRHRFSQDPGNFTAKVSAFTYPEAFEPYNGYSDIRSDTPRRYFGMSYRHALGSGEAIHLVYNAHVGPSPRAWTTMQGGAGLSTFNWDVLTTSIKVRGAKPTAHLVVDTSYAHPTPLANLESLLYGSSSADARLPTPDEVVNLFENYSTFLIVYHDDGTFTASGSDSEVQLLADGKFKINVPSAFYAMDKVSLIRSKWA